MEQECWLSQVLHINKKMFRVSNILDITNDYVKIIKSIKLKENGFAFSEIISVVKFEKNCEGKHNI